jgi:hypothetical protein
MKEIYWQGLRNFKREDNTRAFSYLSIESFGSTISAKYAPFYISRGLYPTVGYIFSGFIMA